MPVGRRPGLRPVAARRHPPRVSTFASGAAEPEVAGSWTEKTIVQHVATPAFSGDLAVTSFQHCRDNAFRGFGLYDVTDPRAPRRLALVRTEVRGSHEIWLQPRGRLRLRLHGRHRRRER